MFIIHVLIGCAIAEVPFITELAFEISSLIVSPATSCAFMRKVHFACVANASRKNKSKFIKLIVK